MPTLDEFNALRNAPVAPAPMKEAPPPVVQQGVQRVGTAAPVVPQSSSPQGTYDPSTRTLVGGNPTGTAMHPAGATPLPTNPEAGGFSGPAKTVGTAYDINGNPIVNRDANGGVTGNQQQVFNSQGAQTPTGSGFDINTGKPVQTAEDMANLAEQQIRNNYASLRNGGGSIIDQQMQADINQARDKATSTFYANQKTQTTQQTQGNASAAGSANTAGTQANAPAPQSGTSLGGQAFIAGLPPEMQQWAPILQEALNASNQEKANATQEAQMGLNGGTMNINGQQVSVPGVTSTYDSIDKKLADVKQGYEDAQTQTQSLLDMAKEQNEKNVNDQETAAMQRAQWDADQNLRTIATNQEKAVDSSVAKLAMTGGLGSSGASGELASTRATFDNQMTAVRNELGVQETEISAKFTALHNDAVNTYVTATVKNIQDTKAALDKVASQSMASTEARNNATNTILSKFMTDMNAAQKEHVSTLMDIAKKAGTMVTDKQKADATATNQAASLNLRREALAQAAKLAGDRNAIGSAKFDQQEGDKQKAATQKFIDDVNNKSLGKDQAPNLESYKTFDTLFNKAKPVLLQGKNDPTALTATVASDLIAQIGQMKSTSRIPIAITNMLHDNQSTIDNIAGWMDKNKGQGSLPQDILKDTAKLMATMHSSLQESAQNELDAKMIGVAAFNAKIQDPYKMYTVHSEDITNAGGLNVSLPSVLDPSSDPASISGNYKTPGTNPVPKTPEGGGGFDPDVGTPSFSDQSPLAQYASSNGLRITQYYNGMYDQNHAQDLTGGQSKVFSDNRATHESYNISPPTPGQKNVPAPTFAGGTVISVQKSDKGYGNSVRIKDANGNTWIYGHLDKVNVKNGDTLNAGDNLGTMGNSGWTSKSGNGKAITMHLEARGPDGRPFDFAADSSNPNANIASTNNTDTSAEDALLQLAMTEDISATQ